MTADPPSPGPGTRTAVATGLVDGVGGNVGSVRSALRRLGVDPVAVRSPSDLDACDRIILPGVGSAPAMRRRLAETGLDAAIVRATEAGRPLLGICVGMHLLASRAEEAEGCEGLDLIPGRVERLVPPPGAGPRVRIPHVGWNAVEPVGQAALLGSDDAYFYFVHAYVFEALERPDVAGTCDHGRRFVAAVQRGHVFGVQFHPERSQRAGLAVLERFVRLDA